MAKKRINTLDTLIPQYAENKSILDDYKKLCDEENKQIKSAMEEQETDKYDVDGYTATKIIQKRQSMNEDKLLEVIAQNPSLSKIRGLVKTRKYVDVSVLESALYKGLVDKESVRQIDKCREVKEVVTLKITKAKEKD